MPDIPAGWIAIITLVFGSITGAIGWLFQYQQKQVAAADDRTKAAQDKLEALQSTQLQEARDQRDALLKRADADRDLAKSLQDQNALILKLAGKAQGS